MMKRHRRINWFRRVLTFTLVFCLVVYVTMMFVTFLSNNDGKVREDLAREMADTASPVIELFGGDMQIAVGDSFCEPGFDIFDDRDLPEVEIESDVNVRQEGEYEIKYTASDESGNHNSMSRKVKVIQPAGRIYLTFDDGPSDYTGVLLDTLKKYGVKATFFVTSYGDDALIRREYDEGHAVGLHTASHVYSYVYSSPENYWADLNQVQDRVKNITGKRSHLIRFPGGSSNMISAWYDGGSKIMSRLSSEVEGQGYAYFDWNVDSGDAGGAGGADEVYNNVVNALKWGGDSVILQHDTKPYSVEAVERIIQYGLENNFVFEILSTSTFTVHHGVNN